MLTNVQSPSIKFFSLLAARNLIEEQPVLTRLLLRVREEAIEM